MSRLSRLCSLAGLLLALAALAAVADGKKECLKRVFNRYCLGGQIADLQRREPGYIDQQRDGERFGLIYTAGGERTYVMAYAGRIYKVLRRYHPATTIRYRELRDLLTAKYGMPQERSKLPAYATGLAAKIGAIRRGEGEALLIWRPADQPWRVELSWAQPLGLSLAYIDNRVDSAQQGVRITSY